MGLPKYIVSLGTCEEGGWRVVTRDVKKWDNDKGVFLKVVWDGKIFMATGDLVINHYTSPGPRYQKGTKYISWKEFKED